jgi:hypothetical protein
MARNLKVCYMAPEGGAVHEVPRRPGDEAASFERIDNTRVMPIDDGTIRPRAAVERLKLWDNGRRLRVKFVDGDPAVQQKVEAIAHEWEAVTNLSLDFVGATSPAEIRISFGDRGFSWSTVGTDALTVPSSQPTMNYGWLTPSTSLREYQRVVRHEFGHALGMIHEHQNPAAAGQIPWDKPKVYAYYAQQGWTEADVDDNIFDVYDSDLTNFTTWDPTSIMQYAIPDELTIGSFAVGWNTELSTTDQDFMRRQYPKDTPGVVELTIGGARHAADLSVGAEVDTYHVDVTAVGTYIITTEGPSDVVLSVHGPNDPGAVVVWDDDRGQGLNARIVRKLFPGQYWLSVRHKQPGGTGVYTIGIKRRR